jgi:hypothetical protein
VFVSVLCIFFLGHSHSSVANARALQYDPQGVNSTSSFELVRRFREIPLWLLPSFTRTKRHPPAPAEDRLVLRLLPERGSDDQHYIAFNQTLRFLQLDLSVSTCFQNNQDKSARETEWSDLGVTATRSEGGRPVAGSDQNRPPRASSSHKCTRRTRNLHQRTWSSYHRT